jgi:hypothetical protein
MLKIKVSTLVKIIKICADTFRDMSSAHSFTDYENACKAKITELVGVPNLFNIKDA